MKRIRSALGEIEVLETSAPGDAEALAFRAASAGFGPVVVVGGDGTIQEVLNGLMRCAEPPSLGIVGAGSANDIVRSLRLPRDPVKAAQLALGGTSGAVDLGVCNGRYFLNVAGMGLDTVVVEAVNARPGRLGRGRTGYIMQALRELRGFENPAFTIRFDDEVLETRSTLLAVANLRFFGGGMKIAPQASPTDGLLDLWIGGDLSHREVLALMPAIFLGQHGRHPKVRHERVSSVRVESAVPLRVQLDGEVCGTLPAEFRVVPRALRIAGWSDS
jgi:YegS/Rv2252/BmrU family lipid kinase